jgi:WD40 repeat protein
MWIQKLRGGVQHLAYSLDGRFLYTLDTGGVLTIWDVATHTGMPTATAMYCRGNYPRGLHPLADGRILIRNERFPVIEVDGDFVSTQFVLIDQSGNVSASDGPPGLNNAFAQINRHGRTYYLDPTQRTILGCDLGSRTPKPVFTPPDGEGLPTRISRFDWSNDGTSLVVMFGGGPLVVFERTAGGKSYDATPIEGEPLAIRVCMSPDGKTVIVFSGRGIGNFLRFSLWDVPTRSVRVRGVECSLPWGLFAFNPVYPLFALCQQDGTLAIWDTDDGRPVRSLDFALGRSVRSAAFSPDGLTCAVGGSNKQFAVFDVDM